MRRNLLEPIAPAPFPAGCALVPFGADIAPACRELMNAVYAAGFGDVVPFETWWPWLTSDSEYHPAYAYVAACDGAVVGVCHTWIGNFIKDVVVDPAHRGRGLGAALVTEALRVYAKAGYESVDLKTSVDNARAQSLYRRLGFAIVERVDP